MASHWRSDPATGEIVCPCQEFHCPYAPEWSKRCTPAICDCFIDTHPEDPFGLHPEIFVVGSHRPPDKEN